MPTKRKPRPARFDVSGAQSARYSVLSMRVPLRWLNAVIAVFLLPLAWVWTQTFFTVFSQAVVKQNFWMTEEFWFFSLGALLWIITFFGLPRPVVIYVFGHELTHAVWVWAMGGRVSKFKVGADGGHIVTNKHNFWIALAPYFFPLYSMLVILGYGIAGFFIHEMHPWHRWLLYGAIGATWAFHISFTLWMIPKGQTDLSYHGNFFSLVVIYLMNLLVLTIFLMAASPHEMPRHFARVFYHNAQDFSEWVRTLAEGKE